MQFIVGSNRHQTYFSSLNDLVSVDNPVRLMDAFVDKLDLLTQLAQKKLFSIKFGQFFLFLTFKVAVFNIEGSSTSVCVALGGVGGLMGCTEFCGHVFQNDFKAK